MTKPITSCVVGYSEINRDPERVVLKISCCSNLESVQELLETFTPRLPTGEATPDAAVIHWSMSSMSTSSYTDRNEKKTVFDASTSFSVKFRDFDKLGIVASTLSVMPNVSIDSIKWMLTDTTIASLVSECRISAAHNAREKARDYAKAFGYQDVQPYEITDNSHGLPSTSTASVMRSKKIMKALGQEQHQLTFRPEAVSMSLSVTVKFNIM